MPKSSDQSVNRSQVVNFPHCFLLSLKKVMFAQSCLTLCNPWMVAYQAPLSVKEWTGVSSYSLLQGGLPNSGIKPRPPALQADFLPSELLVYFLVNPRWCSVSNPPANSGNRRDMGSVPRLGRSPEEGYPFQNSCLENPVDREEGYPLQNSCLENPMDREAWQASF